MKLPHKVASIARAGKTPQKTTPIEGELRIKKRNACEKKNHHFDLRGDKPTGEFTGQETDICTT